jgi:putative tryptophan/tyrosine transport system substrate-binding protein
MAIYIGRRELIVALGGAAVAWPLAARAQQRPIVGYLSAGPSNAFPHLLAAFRQGLSKLGYVEGNNVRIEYRWAEGKYDRLPELADQLLQYRVTAIAAVGGSVSALAAKKAAATIPIVFASGGDPVSDGLVSNLNRPGGNVTGVSFFGGPLGAKRMELLRELVPAAVAIALVINPTNPTSATERLNVLEAAQRLGQQIYVLNASAESDLQDVFDAIVRQGAGAVLFSADTFFTSRRELLAALAARYRVPAIYELREFCVAGGLMSYGTSLARGYTQAGEYIGRILKGETPADLPVVLPTRFELVINLKTARALGLDVPPTLLARADEVIE